MRITVDEAAVYLGLHPGSVRRLARSGELPAVKVGRQWRLDRETLEEWLRTMATRPSLGKNATASRPGQFGAR